MQDASQLKELSRVDNSVEAAQKEIAAVEREGHRLGGWQHRFKERALAK